ncbi:MAG: bifunctional DNA-formamidopyrimidine glycosylase/DNA-(apurinic or apyrimidinic site) lyase [Corynebacterium sp.]|nr:bifunctional DNA-formamidopyrimidine glycosylase/DNA-(apurinic or apyrimidinic site) lyase [Corynebacterium sp.]
MPELPEVEVVRRGLEPFVIGRTFRAVDVLHPRANRGQIGTLSTHLVGRTVKTVRRRGKFLWLEFHGHEDVLLIHLGMSGQLRIGETNSHHVRVSSLLDDDTQLSFVDQRTFGYWRVQDLSHIAHIAKDPLDPDFDLDFVASKLARKSVPIKAALLDQTVASGIGNIYADEALWQAQIHPLVPANKLGRGDIDKLYRAAAEVMVKALAVGGTSFDALYVHVNGESGYFARNLHAYGRADTPCDRCAAPIKKIKIQGRSSHYCPQCQHP